MHNILDYLDKESERNPDRFQLTKSAVLKIEQAIIDTGLDFDDSWAEFKTNGLLNNYRGIPIEIVEEK